MRVVGLNASPNEDGLTASVLKVVLEGAAQTGAETHLVNMKALKLKVCQQCEDGWGLCRKEGRCILEDDFQGLREELHGADAIVLSTPVYFGEVSEVAKTFLDRLRRCEAAGPGGSRLTGKLALGIAAAGGSGGGIVSCQEVLERYFQHMGMRIFDLIPVTRLTRNYKLKTAREAGRALVECVS
ncbi:MAG: flavodoxin family protein [Armatimonadetes bacterium]|nr:flavodoxin family protein [Armatimonadota bacterium]